MVVFGPMRRELPSLDRLLNECDHGTLESSFPPTTIPAWMSMFTGQTPGELGVYGFKHRNGHAMTEPIELVSRLDYQAKPIWEWASRQSLESVVVGVPSTWPVASLRGAMLSDFTTPPKQRFVYPEHHQDALPSDWQWDLMNWRKEEPHNTLDELIKLSERYWTMFQYLLDAHPNWALGILVDIGMDRAHHLFWEPGIDEGQPPKQGGPLWQFYKFIDEQLGRFLKALKPNTHILIVSDHGAQAMEGTFALNQWLLKNELLKPKTAKVGIVNSADVDWKESTWWAEGGYVGKLHLSPFAAQEPISAIQHLERLIAAEDFPNEVKLHLPEQLYPKVRGCPPTAFVEVDNLKVRCIGSLSETQSIWPRDNDLGADAANHHPNGLYIRSWNQSGAERPAKLQDVYEWIKTTLAER